MKLKLDKIEVKYYYCALKYVGYDVDHDYHGVLDINSYFTYSDRSVDDNELYEDSDDASDQDYDGDNQVYGYFNDDDVDI